MLVRDHLLRALLPLLTIVAALAAPDPTRANGPAWTRTEGGYYLRFGVTWLTARHEYGIDGRRHNLFDDTLRFQNAVFGQTDVSLLCEYGVTNWLTAVAQTQLRTVVREAFYAPSSRDTSISASGLTDLWLGARVRLLPVESPYRAAINVAWKAPMGSPTQEIPLGTGVPDYSIGAAAAAPYALGFLTGHVQLSSDFRLRNKASNDIGYAGQFDIEIGRGFSIQGIVDGVHSLADFDGAVGMEGSSGVAINRSLVGDRSFNRWSVGLLLEADEGLDIGASYSDQFGGRNALEATAFSLSATWRSN
jgi:hypothetical protein